MPFQKTFNCYTRIFLKRMLKMSLLKNMSIITSKCPPDLMLIWLSYEKLKIHFNTATRKMQEIPFALVFNTFDCLDANHSPLIYKVKSLKRQVQRVFHLESNIGFTLASAPQL